MSGRRPMGALEDTVLRHLWATNEPATTGDVHEAVGADLAYTTVMTILTRLWKKGLVTRERVGRAYAYRPVRSEADHEAGHMHNVLDRAGDREAVLNSFVDTLSEDESAVLRDLLGES